MTSRNIEGEQKGGIKPRTGVSIDSKSP